MTTDFTEWPIDRTNEEHDKLLSKSNDRKGCIRKKVMDIEPTCCPPDILHIKKKGIISKLLNQVLNWVILQGKEEKLIGQMKEHRIPFT